jgi:hypothetical protein
VHGIQPIQNVKIELVLINHIILMQIVQVIWNLVKQMVLNVLINLINATHWKVYNLFVKHC